MALKVGIIGLPNVGKPTLLNALAKTSAEVSNYPFCTIDSNLRVVDVQDTRLEILAGVIKNRRTQLHYKGRTCNRVPV
ncbi:50S ribosome-binding GTPase [bacterium]|nr:50S ribosome-binding GTPase [bacterium]